jgi:hypothetical protein
VRSTRLHGLSLLALVVLAVLPCTAGGASAPAVPTPRVTVITDSVGGVLWWVSEAQSELGRGFDLRLETKTCRGLVSAGCYAYGEYPPSALPTIDEIGPDLGSLVVIDVGYNDLADGYQDGIDAIMRALTGFGVKRVVWVTLEQTQSTWSEINARIRAAPRRWPQLVVADWAAEAVGTHGSSTQIT